jgi:CubicO group peptidase (beta-lactamase class C family)
MRFGNAILAGVLFGLAASCNAAQGSAVELTRADVDAWLDGLIPAALRAGDIAGGVVVIVKDGAILTERGFGYADVAGKVPVDPQVTLFRPGSISKAFTWTAVMQLVEQGRVDLDADVNRYLDFRIPSLEGKPITLRQIMTHTSGFEESLKGIVGENPAPALGDRLKQWVPERIYAAGTVPAYSNYASALAGYVVERVSGERFEDYVERHIFAPLGMHRSTFRQPVPGALRSQVSKGYLRASEPERYFEILSPEPAGAMSGTGHDMAAFMIAHLQNGRYGDGQILLPDTAIEMHAVQPKHYPALNGMALGLYEHSRNGHRILAHNGGTQFFHSDMHLFIDDGVGIFISLNSPGVADAAAGIHDAFFHGFADRYFPDTAAVTAPTVDAATAVEHARMMAGTWEQSRRSATNILAFFNLLSPVSIEANPDGTISFPLPRHGVIRWREIAPFLWRETDGSEKIQAVLVDGRPAMLGFDMAPPAALLPVAAWRSPAWMLPAIIASGAVLLLTGVGGIVGAVVRRRYRASLKYEGRAALLYRARWIFSLATALLLITVFGTLIYMASSYDRLSSSMDGWLLVVKLSSLLVYIGAFGVAFAALMVCSRARRGWAGRLWSALVVLSCAVTLWTAVVFHLTNLSSHY